MIGERILNYKIVSIIGKGGMGTVYLGCHETLGRKVAIKVLLPQLANDPNIRKRFINEAQTLSTLSHQYIIMLYDFVELRNNLFLIMEYVEGTALDRLIYSQTSPISFERSVSIFNKILSGFSYAHSKGIIHRDIKPSNIILRCDDTPKILDFGIAKIIHGDFKMTQQVLRLGSILYMSPEQVLGKQIDIRSDIYSLGVTFYEMLSRRVPYNITTESDYEIQRKIVNEPLPSLRSIIPDINPIADEVIRKATAKNPLNRFQTCEEFINSLRLLSSTKTHSAYYDKYNKTTTSQTKKGQSVYQPQSKKKKFKENTIIISFLIVVFSALAILLTMLLINGDSTENTSHSNNIPKSSENKKKITITESEVKNFIYQWQTNQNNINIDAYLSQYSPDFQGVKRTKGGKTIYMNYSEWADDRRKMYSSAKNLYIGVSDLVVKELNTDNNTATVEFYQKYSSQKYSDEGQKVIKLKKNANGELKIYYEELLYSIETSEY